MIDRHYSERFLAEIYDDCCAGRPDFDFYLPLVMPAGRVLDVGCGTGELLRLARAHGHDGRLCGLDPAEAMLGIARGRDDIDWVLGAMSTATWSESFDLILMTGHAFQVLLTDDAILQTLRAVASALAPRGCFAFETRNPLARAWEGWTPENGRDIQHKGGIVRWVPQIEGPLAGGLVSFTQTYSSAGWARSEVSRSTLRFLDVAELDALLLEAELDVVERFGNWDRSALTAASPEIITIAGRPTRSGGRER